eukprot:SAG11_NODE_2607_length_3175_cov_11.018205_4_plen_125_part_00
MHSNYPRPAPTVNDEAIPEAKDELFVRFGIQLLHPPAHSLDDIDRQSAFIYIMVSFGCLPIQATCIDIHAGSNGDCGRQPALRCQAALVEPSGLARSDLRPNQQRGHIPAAVSARRFSILEEQV